MKIKRLTEKGFGLVEVLLGVTILAIVAQSMVLSRVMLARATVAKGDRSYASLKSLQILEEIKGQAEDAIYGAGVVDSFNEPTTEVANPLLTADKAVARPDDPLSGNRLTNGHWRYLRQVRVEPVTGNSSARQVTVKVWKYATNERPFLPGLLLSSRTVIYDPGAALHAGQEFSGGQEEVSGPKRQGLPENSHGLADYLP